MGKRTDAPVGGAPHEAIAVIGMGCRLPGDVDSPAALWRLMVTGRDAVGLPPPGRADLWEGHAPGSGPPEGGYLRDVSRFDADFFGVSGREADVLDPQHRLLLEVAWEALEHAGVPPESLAGTPTGVFTGLSYTDYMDRLAGRPEELAGSVLTNGHAVAPGRISYLLGLHGPSIALDTACSSSLVALHLAGHALNAGECDLALAGGVSLVLQARTTRSFARMGMLSDSGRCRTFDAAADGFVRGEGCGVVVLKRHRDALDDGDRILALVRGTALNQDGASEGLAAPSAAAQRAVYREALARAGVDPGDVGMVETHGTGTPVGDPVEFSGLAEVYGTGRDRCALTSVKTHLGHLEPAAGIVGLLKAVSCLVRERIPPNLHFRAWNPEIHPEGTRLFVPTELTEWPVREGPRLAAVSSFGFSGTNAHVVLERAPGQAAGPRVPRPRTGVATPEAFLVAAGSAAALPAAAERLADWLETDEGADVPLGDLAHTLALRRGAGRGRLGVLAASRDQLLGGLRSFARGEPRPRTVVGSVAAGVARRPVWVFSGQGSQWPGMGRGLLAAEPAFRAALAEVDPLIAAEAGFSVLDVVRDGAPVTGCARVQPVLFAVQLGLAAVWRSHGVDPAAVIGHSMGEVAAAVVCGALSPADGVRVICRRSALLDRIAGAGAMASVSLPADAVEAELSGRAVSVAVLSAPGTTVVSGDAAEVERLVEGWAARGVPAAGIAVDVASHSPHVDPLLPDLRAALAELRPGPPLVPFYSTVSETTRATPVLDAAYWCANLRRPVRFTAALAAAAADRHPVFVEVSPHPVVAPAVVQSLAGLIDDPVVLPTLRRGEDEPATLLEQLTALHCAGTAVDWSRRHAGGALVDAPPMTFDRRRHWAAPTGPVGPVGPGTAATPARAPAERTPPGDRTEAPGDPVRHVWRADLGTAAQPWLADHQVYGAPALPGAFSGALALTCAHEVLGGALGEIEVSDLRFEELQPLGGRAVVSTVVTPTGADGARCEIFGRGDDDAWVRRSSAMARRSAAPRGGAPASVRALALRHPRAVPPDDLYAGLRARGIVHGAAFRGIDELYASRTWNSFWARLALPPEARGVARGLAVHPVALDLCAQLVAARIVPEHGARPLLPVGARSLRILGEPEAAEYGHAHVFEVNADGFTGDVRLLDGAGRPVLAMDGLRFAHRAEREPRHAEDGWLMGVAWARRPAGPGAGDPGPAVLLGEDGAAAASLADALRAAGSPVELWPGTEDGAGAEDGAVAEDGAGVERLAEELGERLRLADVAPRALVLLCAGRPADEEPTGAALRNVRALLAAARAVTATPTEPPRLYAVTRGACAVAPHDVPDPAQGALRGVVRVAALEHPELRVTLVDADPGDGWATAAAGEIVRGGPDDEVALRGAERHVARLVRAPIGEGERAAAGTRVVRYGVDGFRLRVGRLGDLESLAPVATGRRAPGPGEVELRVRAAGLNFRDVLTALGLLPGGEDARDRIGFECAGVVTAVGPGVGHVAEGDEALALAMEGGAFGSFVTVPGDAVAPVPRGMDAVAAAGLPLSFLTAWYALRHVARLGAGERVLIHSATGGTGLAAIAVARLLDAEVLATAGSEEKRRHLRGMGIAHVLDSRSLDFGRRVRELSGGEGVDVVLNSLAGPAIRAGLETLRPFGRFVELGVRDILADTPLGLAPLRENITLGSVDLIGLWRSRRDLFGALLREVLDAFDDARLRPFGHQAFPIEAARTPFRLMAGARHIGKLVLTVPDAGETTAARADEGPEVRGDGSYVVTGGLSGLGLACARWLGERGAGHVVLNGRTAPSLAAARTLHELSRAGTKVSVVLGDIADPATAARIVGAATARERRLRGVVHCAMVLADAALTTLEERQLRQVWAPKVTGAWNLHLATEGAPLDWFVVFSSMASLLGNRGQASYAAANAWLDSFAALRTARGMPTLAVNWGPWGEVGAATDFAERGHATISTAEGLRALGKLLAHRRVMTGVIPGEPRSWIPADARDIPFFSEVLPARRAAESGPGAESDARPGAESGESMGPAESMESAAESVPGAAEGHSPDGLSALLRSLPTGLARRDAIERHVSGHIAAVLRVDDRRIDPRTPLRALGFDSLLATEVRVRLERDTGLRLPGNFVWGHPTLESLAGALAERLGVDLS
ncbi:type I polyketide synthase [Streptomyces radicis]|uniref:SDR family NAD(P)-dependent oxidoreductase n=1 Tax=Streptomyces radicis TaxID=1750517 RepID=A0A3A9WHE8_9ACTN|nr:type I polyketide synthase [Streptomyces radicis]RKN12022.1 SDR family NAD(P)-dependent oxidoreductase [Streptomyces radicis]RKN25927.1 SDR family NAD(P)-dependent oxidoreductase [Streptomyces radicis]